VSGDGWRPGPLSPADDDEPPFWTRFGRAEDEAAPRRSEHTTGWFRRRPGTPPIGDPAAAPGFGTAVPAFRSEPASSPTPLRAAGPATAPSAPPSRAVEGSPVERSGVEQSAAQTSAAGTSPAERTAHGRSADETTAASAFSGSDSAPTTSFEALPDDEGGAPTASFPAQKPDRGTGRLLSATAVMAAGTIVSRVLGLVRVVLAAYLLGAETRQADILSMATTVPNSLYILFAGGALNTVLVPQIVRAVKNDRDGGEAYTNRIMTAFLLVVAAVTVVLVIAAPFIAWIYSGSGWHAPAVAPQYQSMVTLTALCLPQVFFYGAFFLGGQVLNARDAFGPMMWAPIANNIVQVLVLVFYAIVWGFHTDTSQPFTTGQLLLLGLGSVFGIAVQTAVLVPFMRRVGFRYRPRFDLRHTGLGHTFHLAKWTLGFVAVNQIALIVVTKLATSATAGGSGAGETAYNNANLLWVLPHSLITVGLATAMLPSLSRMAAGADVTGFRTELTKAIRLAVAALVPVALIFLSLGVPIGEMTFRKGGTLVGWTLVMFAVGLVPFSVQYLVLRGYYAFEDTKSTFAIQVLIAGLNAVFALIGVLLIAPGPNWVAPALAGAYTLAYVVGVAVSMRHFQRHVPGISMAPLLQYLGRVALAALPGTVVAFIVVTLQTRLSGKVLVDILGLGVGVLAAAVAYVAMARWMHIEEVEEVVGVLMRRLRRSAPSPARAASSAEIAAADAAGAEAESPVPGDGSSASASAAGETAVLPAVATAPPPAGDPDAALDTEEEGAPVALEIGDVLGGRFRLEEQLQVRGSTVTWRAVDQVLSRSVLVHVLSPDNSRAPQIIDMARQAARATDSRFLRVLDAVSDAQLSYIVCEWAEGMELEQLLASGPLTALESAWLVRELADALSALHAQGMFHTRLTPESVVVSTAGNVKINGFLIDAALHPRSSVPGTESDDVIALGRLLYATLASRWPGGPGFGLKAAPTDAQGVAVSPAKVRAGVSPTLDRITSEVLAGRIASSAQLTTALTTVLGSADASSDLAHRVRFPMVREGEQADDLQETAVVPAIPLSTSPAAAAARVVVPPAARAHQSPERMLLVTGILVGVVVLALIVGLTTVFARKRDTAASGASGASGTSATSGSASGSKATAYPITGAKDFDPAADGGNGEENPGQVALAYDGKPDTAWTTLVYRGKATFGGLKPGVGLILDLGKPVSVRHVTVTLVGQPTGVELRAPAANAATVTSPPMTNAAQWTVLATNPAAGTSVDLSVRDAVTTRFVMVYLTSLPAASGGFKGGIAEVSVTS
jgi:putative peptidoglycan lipid II flippase